MTGTGPRIAPGAEAGAEGVGRAGPAPAIGPGDGPVLVLQGPLSPFYARIADHLGQAGVDTLRINFCGADHAAWPAPGALKFSGRVQEFPAFLQAEVAPLAPSAVLLHGDRRLYHRAAVAFARARGIPVFVTELGYMRPDWMTLELGGVSTLSHFPNLPDAIRDVAARVDAPTPRTPRGAGPWKTIQGELHFAAWNLILRRRFPHYVSHKQPPAHRVWPGWIANKLGGALRGAPPPPPPLRRFVYALQLEGDFQLRDHSPFADVAEAMAHVIGSFAAHAPGDATLAVKPHPHEFARGHVLRVLSDLRARHGLGDRLALVEGRGIFALCEGAEGFVTINSSAGLEALEAGAPVMSVMPTIYDMPGLSFQGGLDDFWRGASPPDMDLFAALKRAMAGTIQVRGGIQDDAACEEAAANVAARILSGAVNGAGAFAPRPPRLDKARAMGVRYGEWDE